MQAHVIAALDTIREEIRAATPAAPAPVVHEGAASASAAQRASRHSPGPLSRDVAHESPRFARGAARLRDQYSHPARGWVAAGSPWRGR